MRDSPTLCCSSLLRHRPSCSMSLNGASAVMNTDDCLSLGFFRCRFEQPTFSCAWSQLYPQNGWAQQCAARAQRRGPPLPRRCHPPSTLRSMAASRLCSASAAKFGMRLCLRGSFGRGGSPCSTLSNCEPVGVRASQAPSGNVCVCVCVKQTRRTPRVHRNETTFAAAVVTTRTFPRLAVDVCTALSFSATSTLPSPGRGRLPFPCPVGPSVRPSLGAMDGIPAGRAAPFDAAAIAKSAGVTVTSPSPPRALLELRFGFFAGRAADGSATSALPIAPPPPAAASADLAARSLFFTRFNVFFTTRSAFFSFFFSNWSAYGSSPSLTSTAQSCSPLASLARCTTSCGAFGGETGEQSKSVTANAQSSCIVWMSTTLAVLLTL